jgi:hypothetical protein
VKSCVYLMAEPFGITSASLAPDTGGPSNEMPPWTAHDRSASEDHVRVPSSGCASSRHDPAPAAVRAVARRPCGRGTPPRPVLWRRRGGTSRMNIRTVVPVRKPVLDWWLLCPAFLCLGPSADQSAAGAGHQRGARSREPGSGTLGHRRSLSANSHRVMGPRDPPTRAWHAACVDARRGTVADRWRVLARHRAWSAGGVADAGGLSVWRFVAAVMRPW